MRSQSFITLIIFVIANLRAVVSEFNYFDNITVDSLIFARYSISIPAIGKELLRIFLIFYGMLAFKYDEDLIY